MSDQTSLTDIAVRPETFAGIREISSLIHAKEIRAGEWDSIDSNYPEKGPVVAPLLCDNRQKILDEVLRLLQIALSPQPQNRDTSLVGVIYNLLDFCQAHNINVEQLLTKMINENEE